MELVALKCPQCGAKIECDSLRELIFCQFCGYRIVVKEEIQNQKVVIDNSGPLVSSVKMAIAALTNMNYDEAKTYANKAVEYDSDCLDAMLLKATVEKIGGGDGRIYEEMAKNCTNNLNLFSKDDVKKYSGYLVTLKLEKSAFSHHFHSVTIDNILHVSLAEGKPYSTHLRQGQHNISFIDAGGVQKTLFFAVEGNDTFFILSENRKYVVKRDTSGIRGSQKKSSNIRTASVIFPEAYISSNFKTFRLLDECGLAGTGNPGQIVKISFKTGVPNEIRLMEVEKGLIAKGKTYSFTITPEDGSVYKIQLNNGCYEINRID